MESIAVTKPDMAVLKTAGAGLSPFGMLSALFGQEVLRRSRYGPGNYRPAPLELLEEERPAPAVRSAPEVKLDLDLTLIIKALKEEQKKEREQDRRETAQAAQRVLERVLRREEKLRAQETTRYIILQSGLTARGGTVGAIGPVQGAPLGAAVYGGQNQGVPPDIAVSGRQVRGVLPGIVIYGGQKSIALTRVDNVSMGQLPHGGLEPVSSCTAAPAAGGWKPQRQQSRPGFAPREQNRQEGTFYSILLPDVLRRRREEFLREREGAIPSSAAYQTERRMDGAEHVYLKAPISRERLAREVSLAVDHALQKQKNKGHTQPSERQRRDRSRMEEQSAEASAPVSGSQRIDRPHSEKEDNRAGEKAVPPASSIGYTVPEEGESQKEPPAPQRNAAGSAQRGHIAGSSVSALPLVPGAEPGAELVFRGETETTDTVHLPSRDAQTMEIDKAISRQGRLEGEKAQAVSQRKEELGERSPARRSGAPGREVRQLPEQGASQKAEGAGTSPDEGLAYRSGETLRPEGRTLEAADRRQMAIPAASQAAEEAGISPDEGLAYRSGEMLPPEGRTPEAADRRRMAIPAAGRTAEEAGTFPDEEMAYQSGETLRPEGRTLEAADRRQMAIPAAGQAAEEAGNSLNEELAYRSGERLPPEGRRPEAADERQTKQEEADRRSERTGRTAHTLEDQSGQAETCPDKAGAVPPATQESETAGESSKKSAVRAVQQKREAPSKTDQAGVSRQSGGAVQRERIAPRHESAEAAAASVPEEKILVADRSAADGSQTAQAVPVRSPSDSGDALQQALIYREEYIQTSVPTEESPQNAKTERKPQRAAASQSRTVPPAAPGVEEAGESSRPTPQALQAVPIRTTGQIPPFEQQIPLIYGEQSAGTQTSEIQAGKAEAQPERQRVRSTVEGPRQSGVTAIREIRILAPSKTQNGAAAESSHRSLAQGERAVELSYLNPPVATGEDERVQALPPWARRLMDYPDTAVGQRPGGAVSFGQTAKNAGVSAGVGQLPQLSGPETGRQIQWSAPGGAMPPANISYREPRPVETVPGPAPMGERELRRTADKVYRMIEERLRRELRRSGR